MDCVSDPKKESDSPKHQGDGRSSQKLLSARYTDNLERLLKDLEQGRYVQVENERSLTMQIPKRVIEKLMEQAKAKGDDWVEFTLGQLRRMSLEKGEKDKGDREEETD